MKKKHIRKFTKKIHGFVFDIIVDSKKQTITAVMDNRKHVNLYAELTSGLQIFKHYIKDDAVWSHTVTCHKDDTFNVKFGSRLAIKKVYDEMFNDLFVILNRNLQTTKNVHQYIKQSLNTEMDKINSKD